MLELEDSREEIIVTFLVILELMKNQKIRITQEEAFGKIVIDLVEDEPAAEAAGTVNEVIEPEISEPENMVSQSVNVEQEPEEVPEKPRKRHLVARPKKGAVVLSRHAMPIKAKRPGKDGFLIARGSRIWSRRKNRNRRIKGYKKN